MLVLSQLLLFLLSRLSLFQDLKEKKRSKTQKDKKLGDPTLHAVRERYEEEAREEEEETRRAKSEESSLFPSFTGGSE